MKTAPVIFALFWMLNGCGSSLGECDAADRAAYDADLADMETEGIRHRGMHYGQLVVQETCATGRCHASTVFGADRHGAPAELDFDVNYTEAQLMADGRFQDPAVQNRVTKAINNIDDWADDMWSEIEEGSMPPDGELSALDKSAVRNWLACGHEVKATLPVIGGPVSPDGNNLEAALLGMSPCFVCHNPAGGTGLVMVQDSTSPNVCEVYTALTTGNSACGAGALVTPMQPDSSVFIGLISGTSMSCTGQTMPPGGMPLMASDPDTVAKLRTWVMEGAPKPMGCP